MLTAEYKSANSMGSSMGCANDHGGSKHAESMLSGHKKVTERRQTRNEIR